MSRALYSGIALLILACAVSTAHADEYVGSSMKVLDPVIVPASGYSTSSGFTLWSTVAQIAIGTSTSAGYEARSGFEYFPFVTTPALSAVPFSETQIDVSWTAAQGFLGWNVSGYTIGRATASGGPYTYTSVGNILATSVVGLTEDTTYYFVVTVQDTFGRTIATSSQATAATLPGAGGGGGGGGGGSDGEVSVSGYGAAGGVVYLLRDGVLAGTVGIGSDGEFDITLSDFNVGTYLLTMYVIDISGTRSGLLSFPITITSEGSLAQLSGIFLPPTIHFTQNQSSQFVNIGGVTVPNASVGILVLDRGVESVMQTVTADTRGVYVIVFPKSFLENPNRVVKSIASVGGLQSPFGLAIQLADAGTTALRGDFNNDGLINLVDFSVLAYWHRRPGPPERLDLNGDGQITLVDFSILTFYWTG